MEPTYDVEDGVDGLEPSISVDAEGKLSARLDTTVAEAVTEVVVCEIFLVHRKHLAANVELDLGQRSLRSLGRQNVTLQTISTRLGLRDVCSELLTPMALENFESGMEA